MADPDNTSSSSSAAAPPPPSSTSAPATVPTSRFSDRLKGFKKIIKSSNQGPVLNSSSSAPVTGPPPSSSPSHVPSTSSLSSRLKELKDSTKKLFKPSSSSHANPGQVSTTPPTDSISGRAYNVGMSSSKKPMIAKSPTALDARRYMLGKAVVDPPDKRISRKNPPNYEFESNSSRLSSMSKADPVLTSAPVTDSSASPSVPSGLKGFFKSLPSRLKKIFSCASAPPTGSGRG